MHNSFSCERISDSKLSCGVDGRVRGIVSSTLIPCTILHKISGNMTDTLDETGSGVKATESSEQKSKEQITSPILSPSAISRSSQEDNVERRDDVCENENAWKGDSWSQEDVRKFHNREFIFSYIVINKYLSQRIFSFHLL